MWPLICAMENMRSLLLTGINKVYSTCIQEPLQVWSSCLQTVYSHNYIVAMLPFGSITKKHTFG